MCAVTAQLSNLAAHPFNSPYREDTGEDFKAH